MLTTHFSVPLKATIKQHTTLLHSKYWAVHDFQFGSPETMNFAFADSYLELHPLPGTKAPKYLMRTRQSVQNTASQYADYLANGWSPAGSRIRDITI